MYFVSAMTSLSKTSDLHIQVGLRLFYWVSTFSRMSSTISHLLGDHCYTAQIKNTVSMACRIGCLENNFKNKVLIVTDSLTLNPLSYSVTLRFDWISPWRAQRTLESSWFENLKELSLTLLGVNGKPTIFMNRASDVYQLQPVIVIFH